MPRFRILYLAPEQADGYRDKAPKKPPYVLKETHYEEGPELDADTPYELWQRLQEQPETLDVPRPINVGDAVRTEEDQLMVCNFWGFDPAEWRQPTPFDEAGPTTNGTVEQAVGAAAS